MTRRFEIEPGPATIGGGWLLRLLRQEPHGEEVEMDGGVFPPEEGIGEDDAYAGPLHTGEDWLPAHSGREA